MHQLVIKEGSDDKRLKETRLLPGTGDRKWTFLSSHIDAAELTTSYFTI